MVLLKTLSKLEGCPWNISFLFVFSQRHYSIDLKLYFSYLIFIFIPGFEIPTAIQFIAIVLTALYFFLKFIFNKIKKKKVKNN